jgi:hypothetical protein
VEVSLLTQSRCANNVAHASLIEDDFRVGGVFLDFRPQAVNIQLEEFFIIAIVWSPDMLEQLGAGAYASLVLD